MPDAISQTHLEDDNLIANGLQGDQEAFNLLFSKYRRLLYGLASRVLHSHEEAEDAVQNSSLLAFCKLPSFKHEGAFRSWLVRILVNEAVSILRQRKNRLQKFSKPSSSTEVGEIVEHLPSPGPDPEQALVNKQSALALAKKLSGLGAPQRSVLLLCGLEGYTTEEVSVILNVTPTAVRTFSFGRERKLPRRCAHLDSLIALLDLATLGNRSPQKARIALTDVFEQHLAGTRRTSHACRDVWRLCFPFWEFGAKRSTLRH